MIRFIWLFFAVGLTSNGWAEPRSLKSTRFSGTSYVTVRDVADYYNLGRDQARSPERGEYRTAVAQLVLENKRRSILLNGVTHWLTFPVVSARGQLWVSSIDVLKALDPVLRRGRSREKTPVRHVVLDPGHGGKDTGARGQQALEKVLTLDVAKRVQKKLEAAGVNVSLTRTRDTTLGLAERVAIASRRRADLLVSIHFNAGGSAEGIETFCVPPAGGASTAVSARNLFSHAADKTCAGNKFDERNVWLAHCVQRNLLQATGANDRGVRRARFVLIRDAKCPAILVEGGFLSNRSEERRILTPAYRDKLVQAITDGILEYKKAVE